MDITIDNFQDEYPKILELLEKAEFVSLDLELTGIEIDSYIGKFDTFDEIYNKYKNMID